MAKSLTGFKFCAITVKNTQQGVQTDATCNIQQRCVRLHEGFTFLKKKTAVIFRLNTCDTKSGVDSSLVLKLEIKLKHLDPSSLECALVYLMSCLVDEQ